LRKDNGFAFADEYRKLKRIFVTSSSASGITCCVTHFIQNINEQSKNSKVKTPGLRAKQKLIALKLLLSY
jgi:hypothetical protein